MSQASSEGSTKAAGQSFLLTFMRTEPTTQQKLDAERARVQGWQEIAEAIGLPYPPPGTVRKAGRRSRLVLFQEMLYNNLEQNPEDVRGLPLLPPAW
eukprot:3509396-Amphidinium_carterae.1